MIRLNASYTGIEIQVYKNGVPVAPDSTPTATLYRNGTSTSITVTVSSTADTGRYLASFTTLGTSDGWSVNDHITVRTVASIDGASYPAISFDSLGYPSDVDTAGVTTLLSRLTSTRAGLLDNLDAAISTRSTYNGSDTSGTTTLLSRLTSTRAGYLDNLTNLDAAVSSRSTLTLSNVEGSTVLAKQAAVLLIPTNPLLTNDSRLNNLDASISSRSTYNGSDTSGTTTLLSRLTSTRAGLLDNLDAAISTRATPGDVTVSGGFSSADRTELQGKLNAASYTTPPNTTAIATAVNASLIDDFAVIQSAVDAVPTAGEIVVAIESSDVIAKQSTLEDVSDMVAAGL